MSYQSFLRSTSGSGPNVISSPNPIPRKPTAPVPPGLVSYNPPSIYTGFPKTTAPTSASNGLNTPASSARSSALRSNPVTASPSSPAVATNTIASVSPAPDSLTKRPLTTEQINTALKTCLTLQTTATVVHEKRPFAALLLAPDNTTVLFTHYSISHVQHAETELARLAAIHYSQKYLAACTLVSTWEPCAMCTGTIYWTNIGRILYAASESRLKELTGTNNEENMTLSLPCRDILKAGQKDVDVIGPVNEWEDRVVEESRKWWKEHEPSLGQREGSINGSTKPGSVSSASIRQGTPTTWTGEESVLSSIDDEGEYKAELDIDWMR